MRDKLIGQLTLLLISSFIILITACSPESVAITSLPSLTPTLSATPALSSPLTPTYPPPPLPSNTPAPTATLISSASCFTTDGFPFAFMPNNEQLLVRSVNGVQIISLQSMQEVKFLKSPSNINGPFVALSPDGETLAWTFEDGSIQAIRISDQNIVYSINSGQTGPMKLEYSPMGDRLFSASHDGSVKVWDNQGMLETTLQSGSDLLNIGISPDGTLLATVPYDGPVTLWSLKDFHAIKKLGGTGGYDTSDAVFSPDGRFLAVDLAPGLFLWRISDGRELLGTSSPINSMAVAYSPDGRFLAYSDLNNVVLSSPDGSQTIRTLEGHQSPIFELFFSPDSSILVSVAEDIRVWRVEDGKLLAIGKSVCP